MPSPQTCGAPLKSRKAKGRRRSSGERGIRCGSSALPSGVERNGAKSNEGARGPLADLYASFVSARKAPFSDDLVEGSLERCLAALPPLCRRARITRLGDLTGLDRIGLPVMQAVRPAALSEVTTLGRGLSRAEAAVGALME